MKTRIRTILATTIRRLAGYIPEGSSSNEQVAFFVRLLQENQDIKLIAETGFNTGVSSRAFLTARSDTTVVSFDLGQHLSVQSAKTTIDRQFPSRHELILGDSTKTLPAYADNHPGRRFDLIFIDGGHDYEVAKADVLNFQAMSHDHTIVIMDDLTPWVKWGRGPTKAWQEALQEGFIIQAGLYRNGQPVTEPSGRGLDRLWGVGYYRSNKD